MPRLAPVTSASLPAMGLSSVMGGALAGLGGSFIRKKAPVPRKEVLA
jgi:hypothetical protein